MAAPKQFLAIVVDVGPSMCRNPQRKSDAMTAVSEMLLSKMLYSKKDEVMVFLVGTNDTQNALYNAEEGDQYAHIVTCCPAAGLEFAAPTVDLVRTLLSVPAAMADSAGDLLDGIMLACFHLTRLGKPNSRLIVLTDAETAIREVTAGLLDTLDATLNGIGQQLQSLGTAFDVLVVEDEGVAASRAAAAAGAGAARSSDDSASCSVVAPSASSANVRANLAALERLGDWLRETGGCGIVPACDALAAMGTLRARTVSTSVKFRGNLSLAGAAFVPVVMYAATHEARLPTMDKMPRRVFEAQAAAAAEAAAARRLGDGGADAATGEAGPAAEPADGGDEDDDAGADAGGAAAAATGRGRAPKPPKFVVFERLMNRKVKRHGFGVAGGGAGGLRGATSSAAPRVNDEGLVEAEAATLMPHADGAAVAEDEFELVPVSKSDTQRAFRYGRERVPIMDDAALKWEHCAGLEALCFLEAARVPRFLAIATADVVLPLPSHQASTAAVSALTRAMAAESRVLLVRAVNRKNAAPRLCVLLPALAPQLPPETSEDAAGFGDAGAGAAAATAAAPAAFVASAPTGVGVDCFYLVQVPWDDDLRDFPFAPLGRDCQAPHVDGRALASAATAAAPAAAAGAGARAVGRRAAAGAGAAGGAGGDRLAPSLEQLDAADALIDALNLVSGPAVAQLGLLRDPYEPLRMHHPVLTRFHATLRDRAIAAAEDAAGAEGGSESHLVPLAPLDPRVAAYLHPSAALLVAAQKEVSRFRAAFGPGLRRQRNAATDALLGPRQLYAELPPSALGDWVAAASAAAGFALAGGGVKPPAASSAASSSTTAPAAAVGSKRARASAAGSAEAEDGAAAAAAASKRSHPSSDSGSNKPLVTSVSTARPVEDFRAMMTHRALADAAVAGMVAAVARLAKGDALEQDKALEALTALREGCGEAFAEGAFNAALRSLRAQHTAAAGGGGGGGGPSLAPLPFWRRVQRAGISLFHAGETANCADLAVSAAQAEEFLQLADRGTEDAAGASVSASAVPGRIPAAAQEDEPLAEEAQADVEMVNPNQMD